MAEPSTLEKAEKVADATIESNPRLAATPGSAQLKSALTEKLADSHARGQIDLDKFMDRSRDSESRDSDRSR